MIEIKEEFVGCDKYARAQLLGGSDAIVLWLAMKAHASRHLTDGFVSEEDFRALAGAPKAKAKALESLVNAGRVASDGTRGSGLVDRVEHGYQLHDYLDHADSRERVLEKRRLASERKARQRDVTRPVPRDIQRDDRVPDATCPAASRADVPNPTQPDQRSEPPVSPPRGDRVKRLRSEAARTAKLWEFVPDDWPGPDPAARELAKTLGVNADFEAANFRDHEFARPKSDANRAFRTWLRNAAKYSGTKPESPPDPAMAEARRRRDELDQRERAEAEARRKAAAESETGPAPTRTDVQGLLAGIGGGS